MVSLLLGSVLAFAVGEVIFDLENLRNQNLLLTKAYDNVKTQSAWELIKDEDLVLSPVKIGVINVEGVFPNFIYSQNF